MLRAGGRASQRPPQNRGAEVKDQRAGGAAGKGLADKQVHENSMKFYLYFNII